MRMSLFGCATIALVLTAGFVPQVCYSQSNPPAQHCVPGQVWRDAFDGDGICVSPERRNEVHTENALAARRRQPGGGAYGPDTCLQGFVWRGTRPTDHVCVMNKSRDIVARENAGGAVPASPCGGNCRQRAQDKQREIIALRRELAMKQQALAAAKEQERKDLDAMRAADEKFARENPGLGQSTQPSMVDNVSPIKRKINDIEVALRAAELESARLQAAAGGAAPPQPQPGSRSK